jgi:alpha-D-ribose 1-methylphosphonate 5-triphosphate synthase subunit PhnG
MIKARETAKNGLFYIGELLVTEAKVQVEGRIGIGIIAGDEPEAARDLAIIDAAFNAGLEEASGWDERLLEEEARMLRREMDEAARVGRTRVVFESMDRG